MKAQTLVNSPNNAKNGSATRTDSWSQLLKRVGQQRDEQAFKNIFEHFTPLIRGMCLKNDAGSDSAEEVIQEVMIKIWRKSPSYDPNKSAASTWIYTVVRNCRTDLIRKSSRRQIDRSDIDVDDLWDDTEDNQPFVYLQHCRNESMFNHSLEQLPTEQRQVLTQVYMQGKSHSEISVETGLPLGTVKSRVRMGLKKLQSMVKRKYQ